MSDDVIVTRPSNDWASRLTSILTRGKNMQAAAARIFPLYQKLQTQRFATENSSEGQSWQPLSPRYATYKLKRYGGGTKRPTKKNSATQWRSWPGSGTKMLIGTSSLAGAVIGQGAPFEGTDNQTQVYTSTGFRISVNTSGTNAEDKSLAYAKYVAEKRPFMSFSQGSIDQMKSAMKTYLSGE